MNQQPQSVLKDRERQLINKEKAVAQRLEAGRQRLSERFPLVFTLLGAFGLVTTFYGFERIIDRIDILANNPLIMLVTGIVALFITGQLYKKLG